MGLLTGKTALIFGVANKNSIAWGITEAFHNEGATIGLSYAGEMLQKRVVPLAESVGVDFVEQCDVTSDEQLDATFAKAKERFGKIDILVHAIAFADRQDLENQFVATGREGFRKALEISAYSLVALAQRGIALMPDGGSILTLTYYGSEKVMPHYNVMGVAKAALEATVRYLACDLGEKGIRVNAISAGPINTLAARGIGGFGDMLKYHAEHAPLKRNVQAKELGDTGLYLASEMSSGVTGEVLYVDCGYNIMGM